MPITIPIPSQAQIDELRKCFVEKYEQSPPGAPFHPKDIERVKNSDLWCKNFLGITELDVNAALEKLWATCIWRQQNEVNELDASKLNQDILNAGAIFARNKDIDGKPLLVFKAKMHKKGSQNMDELILVVVYWIERIQRENNFSQMTLFFDLQDTGVLNMDLDFVKRIIETFKMYYPNTLNYILVYELTFILNAVFTVIKGLLPPKALEILKTISKKDINNYVDKDNCLACWGGNDDYAFTFVPEN